jgi:ligand-binding sensor domain-containing protein/putative methionine-R-sulfoxide reductase with GAF domain
MRQLLFISILFVSVKTFSQSLEYKFDRLQNIKGLSQRSITSIAQDPSGFIWMGSQDGLLRFDGYEIKIFKSNLRNQNSLADNNVRAIAADAFGNVWVATQGGGLDKYDTRLEKFVHHRNNPKDENSISGNAVWSVLIDKKNNVWAGTWSDGLNVLDSATKKFKRVSATNDPIMAIAQSTDGKIWFGGNGLNFYDPSKGESKNFTLQSEKGERKNAGIRALLVSTSGKIWAGTDEDGIYVLDPETETFNHISGKSPDVSQVYALFENSNGQVLAGTNAGLSIITGETISEIFSYDASNIFSISNNSVRALARDNQEGIWIGCEGGGMNKLLERKKFQLFRHEAGNPNSLSFNLIRSIYDDREGNIWVGTQGGGLNLFDHEEKKFKVAENGGKSFKLSSNQISSLYQDKQGTFWVGTWGFGLNKVDLATNQVKVYKHEGKNSLPDDRIQITYEDKQGNFWVGTESGLASFDRVSETWKQYAHSENDPNSIIGNNIQGQAFVETEDGSLWIGTWFGLNRLNKERTKFEHFVSDTTNSNSLSSDHVISLHADKNGNLWMGTFGGGLNQLEIQSGKIIHYTEEEGLANNTIFGIKEDLEGNLWMSTSNGLSRFNPKTKTFINYDASEGLQSNEFYWGAAHVTRNGEMLFGGINGLNFFNPSEIKDNKNIPPVLITDFQIFNKSVPVIAGSLLEQTIQNTQVIHLSYDQAVISFQFAALNYNYPEKNQYAYQLENFDKDWNYVGNKRTATYTNLDPGEYIFKVKGSNNDNIWNEKGVSVKIIISPPFWRTWWFYLLALSVIIGAFYTFVKFRVRQVKHDKELMRQSLEKSLAEAKHELEKQKQSILDEQEKNKERVWTDQSMAKFAEILSQSKNNVKALSSGVLNSLVRHLNVAGGAVYLHDKEKDILKVEASYGFDQHPDIDTEEGMVGMCFKHKETQLINNLPSAYFKISSGLGEVKPSSLLLIPLVYEDICIGVIELASFKELEKYQVHFVQELSNRLTTALNTTVMAQNTEELLRESKIQAEELKVREEELKQNLEELTAINEDRDRRTRELEDQIRDLKMKLGQH